MLNMPVSVIKISRLALLRFNAQVLPLPDFDLRSIVVVVLLFYIHGKQLSGHVILIRLFLGRIRHYKRLTSASCTYLRQ